MLEGVRRSKNNKDTRLPISEGMLQRIITHLPLICLSSYEVNLYSAAFCLAFYGLLRIGEITFGGNYQSDHVLGLSSLKFVSNEKEVSLLVTVPYSKNDQYGNSASIRIPETKSSTCPVAHMRSFLAMRPQCKGPLFCHYSGAPLTRYQFSAILSKVINIVGDKSVKGKFRSHSFRIGRASDLFDKGFSIDDIKIMGRWKSDAYKSYIR